MNSAFAKESVLGAVICYYWLRRSMYHVPGSTHGRYFAPPVVFYHSLLLLHYSCPSPSPSAPLCPSPPCSHSQFPQCCPRLWVIHTCSLSSALPLSPPPLLQESSFCPMPPTVYIYFSSNFPNISSLISLPSMNFLQNNLFFKDLEVFVQFEDWEGGWRDRRNGEDKRRCYIK